MGEPLRVAHVVGKVVLGGVDQVVLNYHKHVDRSRVQFDWFVDGLEPTPLDDEIQELGGRLVRLPAYDDDLKANLTVFKTALAEGGYQAVHAHLNTLSVFWLRQAAKIGVPIRIAHSHSTAARGEWVRTLPKHLLRPFSRRYATHFMACTEHAARWLFGERLVDSGKVSVLPNAIELERFSFSDSGRAAVREDLGLVGRNVVGHVGRFMYQKNHEFLVKSFAVVAKRDADAMLLLVGDGELRKEVEDQVTALGLADRVVFTGRRTDVPNLLQSMDVLAFPSRYEGLGMAVIEARATGLPCLISEYVPIEPTQHITQVPLEGRSGGSDIWADNLLAAMREPLDRHITDPSIIPAYDIRAQAPKLTEWYEGVVNALGGETT